MSDVHLVQAAAQTWCFVDSDVVWNEHNAWYEKRIHAKCMFGHTFYSNLSRRANHFTHWDLMGLLLPRTKHILSSAHNENLGNYPAHLVNRVPYKQLDRKKIKRSRRHLGKGRLDAFENVLNGGSCPRRNKIVMGLCIRNTRYGNIFSFQNNHPFSLGP